MGALLLALAAALVACDSGDIPVDETAPSPATTDPATLVPPPPSETALPETEIGPLEELVAPAWEGSMVGLSQIVARYNGYEERVEACMAERGFPYWPEELTVPADLLAAPERGTRAYAEAYGYGITTDSPEMAMLRVWPVEMSQEQIAYEDRLNYAQGEEYEFALYGPGEPQGWPGDGEAEQIGCYDVSQLGYSFWHLGGSDEAAYHRATQFLTAIPNDPAMADLNAEWAACMATRGFTEQNPSATVSRFYLLQMQAESNPDWGEAEPTMIEAAGSGPILWMSEGAVSAEEVAIAVADFDCEIETDYPERASQISVQLQREYIAEHSEEIEALRAAVGGP